MAKYLDPFGAVTPKGQPDRHFKRGHMRYSMAAIMIVLSAVCLSRGDITVPSPEREAIERILGQVSVDNLRRTLADLERFEARFTRHQQNNVADYLCQRLSGDGLEVGVQEYQHGHELWRNVVVTFTGNRNPAEIFMVISHYDSIASQPEGPAPGADDNGTGTAAGLEIARVLKGVSLSSTVKIVFFSNEEQGRAGSKHYAGNARIANETIRGVVNLDVIGYNDPRGSLALPNLWKEPLKTIKGYALSSFSPRGKVTIAGRPSETGLVNKAASALEAFTALKAHKDIREDCG